MFWSKDSRHLLNRFGNVNNIADGDGMQIYYQKDGGSEEYLVSDAVDGQSLLQDSPVLHAAMDNNMRVNNRTSHTDLFVQFPQKSPKVLESGTADLFGARVRDDLTGMDGLRVRIMGFKVSI